MFVVVRKVKYLFLAGVGLMMKKGGGSVSPKCAHMGKSPPPIVRQIIIFPYQASFSGEKLELLTRGFLPRPARYAPTTRQTLSRQTKRRSLLLTGGGHLGTGNCDCQQPHLFFYMGEPLLLPSW